MQHYDAWMDSLMPTLAIPNVVSTIERLGHTAAVRVCSKSLSFLQQIVTTSTFPRHALYFSARNCFLEIFKPWRSKWVNFFCWSYCNSLRDGNVMRTICFNNYPITIIYDMNKWLTLSKLAVDRNGVQNQLLIKHKTHDYYKKEGLYQPTPHFCCHGLFSTISNLFPCLCFPR